MESRKRRTRRSRSFMREQEEYSDISIPITREREDKPVRKAKKKGAALKFVGILLLFFLALFLFWRFVSPYFGKPYRTIAIFGLDNREGKKEAGALSDVIMLASMNKRTGEIKLCSVYRDTYAEIDGNGTYHKMNEAYFLGGHEQAVKALERNLDIRIDDYVSFTWAAVAKGISALGGVDLELSDAEFYYINAFITETVQSTGIPSVQLPHAGMNHLDGIQAVSYGRLRLMDTDFNRTARQRKVLSLAMEKAKKAGPLKLASVAAQVLPEVSTSMNMADFTSLAAQVGRYHLGETGGFPFARTTKKIRKMDVVIPATLESNVVELHQFLYGDSSYTPSSEVQKISSHIAEVSGVKKVLPNAEEVGTGGGTVRKKDARKGKVAESTEKSKKKAETEGAKKQETKKETEEETTVKNKKETKEEKKSTEEESKETKEKKETEETVEVGPGAALGGKSLETEENADAPGT